jgi:hypothetical protein
MMNGLILFTGHTLPRLITTCARTHRLALPQARFLVMMRAVSMDRT